MVHVPYVFVEKWCGFDTVRQAHMSHEREASEAVCLYIHALTGTMVRRAPPLGLVALHVPTTRDERLDSVYRRKRSR